MKITVTPAFLPGDVALVLNYRKRPPEWEACEVERVKATFSSTGKPSMSYEVKTERLVAGAYRPEWLHPVRLTVGDDGIRPLNQDAGAKGR